MTNPSIDRQHLPQKPGIYIFKDADGQILYVGKAINLKNRVSSYFSSRLTDRPWTAVMVPQIAEIETIVVTNELEALMLEATLIKQHLPRFNIKLTDDKSYPYIKLITTEPFPRFLVSRRRDDKKATYFGPYLSARMANHTLEFLRHLYGIHISSTPLKVRHRACLNCQLDGFTCPLNGEVSEERYQERVEGAVDFLRGKRKNLVAVIENQMLSAARHEQYEVAAKLRDRLESVTKITERQRVISTSFDSYDAVGAALSDNLAVISLLRIREGSVINQQAFFFDAVDTSDISAIVRQFLITHYQNFSDIPPLVVLPAKIEDESVISSLFSNLSGRTVELRVAERGEKQRLLELANKNAQAKLETRLLKTDHAYSAVFALKELLGLDFLPERIEAVDISNLGTSEPVGATVCFTGGQPDKNEYRRYKIRKLHYKDYSKKKTPHKDAIVGAEGEGDSIRQAPNDFAMIREVVSRRFADSSRPVPDLFVVDGGSEQLKFALDGLVGAPVQPRAIIALAKKPDRIFRPGRQQPVANTRGSKGLLLLARVRDETHRYVISFQRQRQRKKSLHD